MFQIIINVLAILILFLSVINMILMAYEMIRSIKKDKKLDERFCKDLEKLLKEFKD